MTDTQSITNICSAHGVEPTPEISAQLLTMPQKMWGAWLEGWKFMEKENKHLRECIESLQGIVQSYVVKDIENYKNLNQ